MTPQTQSELIRDETEIARLVSKARSEGEPDHFCGKRRWTRYQLGLRLEVTTGTGLPEDAWSVTMHNISGGGFGFWSKRSLNEYDQIFVREWSDTETTEWLPAVVTHCTAGIQGFLVGAAFENPCPHGEEWELNSVPAVEKPELPAPNGKSDAQSQRECGLRTKAAIITAGGAVFGAGVMAIALLLPALHITPGQAVLGSMLLAAGIGATGAALMFRAEARFLTSFRDALQRMAVFGVNPPALKEAPTKELVTLRRAFLNVGNRWRQHEEDERAQRQRLEELTQMKSNILSIVSHDLRTPLTSILLYTEMLANDLRALAEEDQRHFLNIISTECNRLSRLVDDLLEVQRLESDRVRWDMRPLDLSETVRGCARVFEAMAKSKSIDFEVCCPDALPPCEADADKISQVISNLLSNAMKYTPHSGKVRLSADARGGSILFRVADTGPGIPRDKWDQLFDRFAQLGDPNVTQIDGFGLGLYIVKRIVECHGGAAWLDSEVGQGSEFSIALPIRMEDRQRRDHTRPPSSGRVLICDPDPELAAMLAQTLRWADYETRVCHSGSRLLAQLTHGDLDAVVTELLLPDMNAQEVLEMVTGRRDESLGVIIHSYADGATVDAVDGIDAFLRRPVARQELIVTVQAAIQRRRRSRGRVAVVGDGAGPSGDVAAFLSEAGYTPAVIEGLSSLVSGAVHPQATVVLVLATLLDDEWSQLASLAERHPALPPVIVLCDAVRRREQRLAELYGVGVCVYRTDQPSSLVDAITEATSPVFSETA